eukprot:scaffold7067_cov245-Pinguiococcus_pyrenoidosus.AAC.3
MESSVSFASNRVRAPRPTLLLPPSGTGNTQDQSVDPIKIFVEEQGIGAVNTLSAAVRLGGPLHENGQRDPQVRATRLPRLLLRRGPCRG